MMIVAYVFLGIGAIALGALILSALPWVFDIRWRSHKKWKRDDKAKKWTPPQPPEKRGL